MKYRKNNPIRVTDPRYLQLKRHAHFLKRILSDQKKQHFLKSKSLVNWLQTALDNDETTIKKFYQTSMDGLRKALQEDVEYKKVNHL